MDVWLGEWGLSLSVPLATCLFPASSPFSLGRCIYFPSSLALPISQECLGDMKFRESYRMTLFTITFSFNGLQASLGFIWYMARMVCVRQYVL